MNRGKAPIVADCLLLAVLWFAAAVLAGPAGDFPLRDDWSYARTVQTLYQTGSFRPLAWQSMPLLSQALWGWLFCIPAGFSFTALRGSTITLGFAGILATYFLLRENNGSRRMALAGALAVAANPIYFALSQSFMTDVPFTAFSTIAACFFLRALRSRSAIPIFAATVFSLIAVLCRQVGIILPLVFAFVYFAKSERGLRSIAFALLPLLAAGLAWLAFGQWMSAAGTLPKLYSLQTDVLRAAVSQQSLPELLYSFLRESLSVFLYLGLFLLPVLLLTASPEKGSSRTLSVQVAALLLFSIPFFLSRKPMPLLQDVLSEGGVGPIMLYDSYILGHSGLPILPPWFWILISLLSIAGAVSLGTFFLNRCRRLFRDPDEIGAKIVLPFLLLSSLLFAAPIVVLGTWDRYLLPALPLLLAALCGARTGSPSPFFSRVAFAALGLSLLFSVATTHDYLQLNRTRWSALEDLRSREKVQPSQIDGGFEFNGWYLYNPDYKWHSGKSWWWVDDNQYLAAVSNVDGYEVLSTHPYSRWIPPFRFQLLLLKRAGEKSAAAKTPSLEDFSASGKTEFSFFLLALALRTGHPSLDCFDRAFDSQAERLADPASQLALLEQKEQAALKLTGDRKNFRLGLFQIARILLESRQAFANKGNNWVQAYDTAHFRKQYSLAVSLFHDSGMMGIEIESELRKAAQRIDQNGDNTFSDSEIEAFLAPKLNRTASKPGR